jgi:hypothetical protein
LGISRFPKADQQLFCLLGFDSGDRIRAELARHGENTEARWLEALS